MTTTIHGIRSCDTVKKARSWLDSKGVAHRFHDFRVDGLDAATLRRWAEAVGWETLLNRHSTTFRALPDDQKSGIDREAAEKLMLDEPTLIKRPVLDIDGAITVGFKPDLYEAVLRR